MKIVRRFSSLVVVLALGIVSASTVACTGDAAPANDDGTSEADFTADIAKSEALLARAVKIAERVKAGQICEDVSENVDEGQVGRFAVVQALREAVAARDTVFFRTRVVAKKAILNEVLAGSLEWQEIVGTYNPKKPETLGTALAIGVNLWDTNGGVFGNQRRIELRADGKASVFTMDTESPDFHWNEAPTTWTLENNDTLKLGTGKTYKLKHNGDFLMATEPGEQFNAFVSTQSECEA